MSKSAYVTLISLLVLTASSNLLGQDAAPQTSKASLSVTIFDDNGSLVHSAHVYIFSQDRKQFYESRDAYGATTFDLPPGEYRIYAGLTLKANDTVDHYASPEASVHLSTDEPTSVILSLQKAPEAGEMLLSDSARAKLDINPELAKYLN